MRNRYDKSRVKLCHFYRKQKNTEHQQISISEILINLKHPGVSLFKKEIKKITLILFVNAFHLYFKLTPSKLDYA